MIAPTSSPSSSTGVYAWFGRSARRPSRRTQPSSTQYRSWSDGSPSASASSPRSPSVPAAPSRCSSSPTASACASWPRSRPIRNANGTAAKTSCHATGRMPGTWSPVDGLGGERDRDERDQRDPGPQQRREHAALGAARGAPARGEDPDHRARERDGRDAREDVADVAERGRARDLDDALRAARRTPRGRTAGSAARRRRTARRRRRRAGGRSGGAACPPDRRAAGARTRRGRGSTPGRRT